MILNDGVTSYTFSLLPGNMTVIRKDKSCTSVQTYEGAAYFSWGTSIVGKELSLFWNAMSGGRLHRRRSCAMPLSWT